MLSKANPSKKITMWNFFIHPIIRLYKNGIAHVTFVDTEERNVDLNDFIKKHFKPTFKTKQFDYYQHRVRQEFVTARLFRNATT